jgi:hypothetical protein
MSDLPQADIDRIVKAAVREVMAQTVATPRQDLSDIAAAAAHKAVNEAHIKMFAALGYDMANLKDVNRLRANLEFLNAFHRNTSAAAAKFFFVTVAVIASAFVAATWLGFKSALHK